MNEKVFEFFEKEVPQFFGGTPEIRPQQVSMAQYVMHSVHSNKPSVIEAKVGTGKTLAYLFPMLSASKKQKSPVIIATSSITLQEQILKSDLEVLRNLGYDFQAIVAKGAQQYYCEQNYKLNYEKISDEDKQIIDRFREGTSTGDRSEVGSLSEKTWGMVSIKSTKDCADCSYRYSDCKYWRTREAFKDPKNNFIITNHQQLIQDLRNRIKPPRERKLLFPDNIAGIVVDEAHNLEQAAILIFSEQIFIHGFSDTARSLLKRKWVTFSIKDKSEYENKIRRFTNNITSLVKKFPNAMRVPLPIKSPYFAARLKETILLFENLYSLAEIHMDDYDPLLERVERCRNLLQLLEHDELYVSWYEPEPKTLIILSKEISDHINYLFRDLRYQMPIVMTSATINSGGSFDYFYRSISLNPDKWNNHEIELSSPFNYNERSILYVGEDLPQYQREADPQAQNDILDAIDNRIVELLNISEGRALVLFTSHLHMQRSHEAIRKQIPWKTISQSDGSKEHVSKMFKESDEPTVLFGTGAFWEGFDVPGEQLVNVIIVRLPFPSDDPYIQLKQDEALEEGRKPFEDVILPEAIIKLKQGFGRLIRRKDDYGMIAILDSRIAIKTYSKVIFDSLPNAVRTSSLGDVGNFFMEMNFSEKRIGRTNSYSRDQVHFEPIPLSKPQVVKDLVTHRLGSVDRDAILRKQEELSKRDAETKNKLKPALPTESMTSRGYQKGKYKFHCMVCGNSYWRDNKPDKCPTSSCLNKNLEQV